MFDMFLVALTALAGGIIIYYSTIKKLQRRVEILEEDIARYTDVIAKMAEVQSRTFDKFSRRFDELDERILDLSVPSYNPDMPLEKRHQVLSLAKNGVSINEIVDRVKAPVGEAELILNLRKYQRGLKTTSASKAMAARVS